VEFIIGALTLAVVYCIWRRLQEVQITAQDEKVSQAADSAADSAAGSGSILADRLGKLDAATQGWKKRVGPTDAVQFSVAGRMMMEHTRSSGLTCASDITLTPTAPASPLSQLLGQSPVDGKRKTPRAERFRSKRGESTSCFCYIVHILHFQVGHLYHAVQGLIIWSFISFDFVLCINMNFGHIECVKTFIFRNHIFMKCGMEWP